MKRFGLPAPAWAVLLFGIGLMALAACGGDGGTPPATATVAAPAASPTSPTEPTATLPPSPTSPAFEGAKEPVEREAVPGQQTAILIDVRTGRHEGFDRLVFEFEGALPGYRIEYVSPPIAACGSGLPVEVAGGAYIRARFFPAAGHDLETGETTFEPLELAPGLPTLLEVESTCDFEGEVAWVAGLSGEVDFRVLELTEPFRVVVDAAHP